MTVWIQRHDLSSENLEDTSVESVISVLKDFDWVGERQKEKAARDSGKDHCPAGIGIIHDDGQILHVVPADDGTSMCHYHYPVKQRKILGIFRKKPLQQTMTFTDVAEKDLLSTIRAHNMGNHGQVMNRLAQMATRV